MEINNLRNYILKNSLVSECLARYADGCAHVRSKKNQILKGLEYTTAFQWLIEHKRHIAMCLHIVWLIGCGYWLYQFMIIDAQPKANMGLVLNDSRDALVILFFGIMGSGFAIFVAFFIIKLIYNLFHDGIESSFPMRWHSIVKPVSYMVVLYFAFSFTGTIKMAGLTAYNQFIAIVETSRQQDMIIKKEMPEDFERKMNELIRLFDENDGE